MKYVINAAADIESILIESLRSHLNNDVRFNKIFPQFAEVRIGGIHPFVNLMDAQVNNVELPDAQSLFPSITIIDDSDMKDMDAGMATLEHDTTVRNEEVSNIEDDTEQYYYIVSDEDTKQLRELVNTNDQFAQGSSQRRKSSMVGEIWSRNVKVKNRLYDILRNFLVMKGRFDLHRDCDITIVEPSISGQKSGNFNFDFGYIIYGAIIRFELVHVIRQYIVDTEIEAIASIAHSYTEVNHE